MKKRTLTAITRAVSPGLADCELTHLARQKIDVAKAIADALSDFRPLKFIQPPATIEGGDVMRVDRTLYAGLSGRTNREGASQLREIVEPYNYRVETIETAGGRRLKTGCVYLGRQTILSLIFESDD